MRDEQAQHKITLSIPRETWEAANELAREHQRSFTKAHDCSSDPAVTGTRNFACPSGLSKRWLPCLSAFLNTNHRCAILASLSSLYPTPHCRDRDAFDLTGALCSQRQFVQ